MHVTAIFLSIANQSATATHYFVSCQIRAMNINTLLVLFTFLSLFHAAIAQQKDEFVLVKEEENIFIYERWISFPKSNPPVPAREVKGEFVFRNTIPAAIRVLQNEETISKWQSHVSEFKVYLTADSLTWKEYSYHDIPWPVSDQDHVLLYRIEKYTPEEVFITFESVKDDKLAPVRKGVTRMELSGSWTFARLPGGKVKATYRILSMPLNIPKFLTDPIIRNNMMTTIQEFIVLVEQKKK
jgi:hypothetical protein